MPEIQRRAEEAAKLRRIIPAADQPVGGLRAWDDTQKMVSHFRTATLSPGWNGSDRPRADIRRAFFATPKRTWNFRKVQLWALGAGNSPSQVVGCSGKPVENAYIESFNGRFWDECVNEHWFLTMAHAREVIERCRIEYDTERPHCSLGNLAPEQFAEPNLSAECATHD